MRIARLDLSAYGPFTARRLTFGSGPGLHLVYGENEAGKSTTLRAISSVLFGYPRELVDVFRHGDHMVWGLTHRALTQFLDHLTGDQ